MHEVVYSPTTHENVWDEKVTCQGRNYHFHAWKYRKVGLLIKVKMKAPPIRTTVCSVSVQITAVRPPVT